MRPVPAVITGVWMDSLSDDDMVAVEARLYAKLAQLQRRESKLHGSRYQLFRSPADVLEAWDRWSRVTGMLRGRSLIPRRGRAGAEVQAEADLSGADA